MTTSSQPQWTGIIRKNLVKAENLPKPLTINDEITFGQHPTPHMLSCEYSPETGWKDAEIKPFAPLTVFPDAVAFHYGQQIFEGMKAYRGKDDDVFLFRPDMNAERFYNSAVRLGMAPVPTEMFQKCVEALVDVDRDCVLDSPGSLYIRPFSIPLDRGVSLRPGQNYLFSVILSPAKAYYASSTGVSVFIEKKLVRAAPGGVGEAKCGGNYSASLLPMAKAKEAGAEQILWLDAAEHEYIEEVGAMNIMFVYGDRIVTPKLSGSILPGVTRNSVIKLAPTLGYSIEEKRISIKDVIADIQSGKITECFGCGTAAVVSPVAKFLDDEGDYKLPENGNPVATKIKDNLVAIQNGVSTDPMNWRVTIPKA